MNLQNAAGYLWAIKLWRGEFLNREHEQAFLRQHARLIVVQMRLALLPIPGIPALASNRLMPG